MEILVADGPLTVGRLVVGPLENNVWLLACTATGEAVIIDAADEPDRILAAAAPYQVGSVLTTHSHADHLGAAAAVCAALDVPFRIGADDAAAAGIESCDPIEADEAIHCGRVSLRAIHTPGHTPGSTCFLTGDLLFTGDTLFPGGPGATADRARFEEIMKSLETHLFTLPDRTRVLPGHGPSTTIGSERPDVAEWWRRGW